MSILYLVATPIGNLEDLSARAIRILGEVSLIAAEDTRHTAKLLNHFEIKTKSTSYFEHNKKSKLSRVLRALDEGDVALVSDAGTPGLNDPGYLLVKAAVENGHTVSPIPGPSAPIAALVSSGLPTDRFLYLGYLPRKSHERRQLLAGIKDHIYTLIFLESPHRLAASLVDINLELGNRNVAVAGELTKMYEEIFRGPVEEAIKHYEKNPARGEFTLVVEGNSGESEPWEEEVVLDQIRNKLEEKIPSSRIAKEIALESGWARRDIYSLVTKLRDDQK